MTTFFLIRHATTHMVGKTLAGRLPGVHLNDPGLVQAEKLAGKLSEINFSAIYASALERTVQTAAAIAKQQKLQVTVLEDFLELDYGKWTGKPFEELLTLHEFKLFNTFRSNARIPGGETMAEAQARMVRGLEKLSKIHEGGRIAVVGHADLIKATLCWFMGIPLDLMQRIEISPASVSVLEVFEETARVTKVNWTAEMA